MRESVLLSTLRDEEKPLIHLTKLRYFGVVRTLIIKKFSKSKEETNY